MRIYCNDETEKVALKYVLEKGINALNYNKKKDFEILKIISKSNYDFIHGEMEDIYMKSDNIIIDDLGGRHINCPCCGALLDKLSCIEDSYAAYDLYKCDICNIGVKAQTYTTSNITRYIKIQPTSISDINTIISNRERLKALKCKK